jgi:anti-sigma B factor antagonist
MANLRFQDQLSHAFRLTVRCHGPWALLKASGDLDFVSAGELDRALVTQVRSGGTVVLDLREIAFIDASGVSVVLRAAVTAVAAGTKLTLMSGECVRRMMERSGDQVPVMDEGPSPN